MDVYVYKAGLLCAPCGILQQSAAKVHYRVKTGATRSDSDTYPQGPFSNGGGEADCPQHCDSCGEFLENPLTPDGVAYVTAALGEGRGTALRHRNQDVLNQWRAFYLL